jgi:hypothetical protein
MGSVHKKNKFCLPGLKNCSVFCLHPKYGEKLLDSYECPLQLLQNYNETTMLGFFKKSNN